MAEIQIPKQHKACLYTDPGKVAVSVEMVDTQEPGAGEVLINLTHSGVCHSDYSIMSNAWPAFPAPAPKNQIGGHEGVGLIVKLGPGAEKYGRKVGDRVGVKWVSAICNNCAACFEGYDGMCLNAKISGYYTPGTYQQFVVGPADYVTPIPKGLKSEDAAPMLCAGVTSYSALKRSNAQPGQWVVISGAGGGLGHIAVQLAAKGMGLRVIGLDFGTKKELVMECGAEHFIDSVATSAEDQTKQVKELTGGLGAQAVIMVNSSNDAYATGLKLLKFNGVMVCAGLPEGELVPIKDAAPAYLITRGINISSVAVGNRREVAECLDMAARGLVKTKVAVRKMDQLEQTFRDMEERKLMGRVVLDLR